MLEPAQLRFDVSADVSPNDQQCHIQATFFPPEHAGDHQLTAVVAVPGGTYTRGYWDLQVPGRESYSFAEFFARQGFAVLTLDNLGTGESTRPHRHEYLTAESVAAANAAVARQFVDRIQSGSLVPGCTSVRLVGVGHSMGGQLTAVQQAVHHSFERIALLGSSFRGCWNMGVLEESVAAEMLSNMAGTSWDSGYLNVPRELLRDLFHAPDVPDDVLAADEATVTVLPRQLGVSNLAPVGLRSVVEKIDVPIFLAFGEIADTAPDPEAEIDCYPSSPAVTLFRLPESAHNHNHATSRRVLWQRLLEWLRKW
ncbi:alpha/beta hydrolase [[Mycobacterium] vasticus]|uniref:Alpha/beta fold hydrolase n=1 Tax=[Mycobacterium] vasticus TaxID=2875777 RepID=A0ABU5Z2P6_9MYCO|nr:alpha/beta fold hydrolase [Mycolicibacter sp. MYC017]MEB3071687.1 alpha/beta fold hydrolase [Mycolicibacter sp. MYC017]